MSIFPEILAPAGSMESLIAALRCGADAVYIGGKNFSARSNASNFDINEIHKAAELCHLYSAKLYLAVNTVITDSETPDFCDFIKKTALCGIDAYIVQDLGCAELIKKCVPNAVLHGSTQMTVHTAKGAELLREMGFSRVVPARELNKKQIAEISKTGIEVEVFIHGALCMSVSGQCYMSAIIGSRSANRGCCAQACRLPFSACGNKNFCGLSLKDLSLISKIDELKSTGVCSLKIEGRMKRPEYAASAVSALKQACDGLTPDTEMLRSVFSRDGFTDGYFTGNLSNMFGTRQKSDVIAAKDILPEIRQSYAKERKVYKISFDITVKADLPIKLTALCNNLSVTVTGEIPQTAINKPIDKQYIEKQLSKLGDTVFEYDNTTADIDAELMVPASQLNELRRKSVEKLYKLIIENNTPNYDITDFTPNVKSKPRKSDSFKLHVYCSNINQADAVFKSADMLALPLKNCLSVISDKRKYISKLIINPPRFISDEKKLISQLNELYSNGFRHLLCVNPAYIKIGNEIGFTLHGGFGLNICNSYSLNSLDSLELSDAVVSFELKLIQIEKLNSNIPIGAVVYGYLPLMLTKNCPIRNEIGCQRCKKTISDRTGRNFTVKCHDKDYVEILNSELLFMADKASDLKCLDFGVIMFENESPQDAEEIVSKWTSQKINHPSKITRGLYYRGIQ